MTVVINSLDLSVKVILLAKQPNIMDLTPMPPYFIIKIGKEEQKEKKEKIGSLYFPPEYAFMRREKQWGEVVSIGIDAQKYMPMAEPGDFLLFHHFVSGKHTDNGYNFYTVGEDSDFFYYAVNSYEVPGERPLAFAIAKGTEIIPTPDYIFLEVDNPKEDEMEVSQGGILIPKTKKKDRDYWTQVMKKNMERVKQLARNIPQSPLEEIMMRENPEKREVHDYAISEMKRLESENVRISKDINKKRFEPFKVAAINPDWNESVKRSFGQSMQVGDEGYFLNMATHYKMDFSGTEFIIAETKYFAGPLNYFREVIKNFKNANSSCDRTASAQKTN